MKIFSIEYNQYLSADLISYKWPFTMRTLILSDRYLFCLFQLLSVLFVAEHILDQELKD